MSDSDKAFPGSFDAYLSRHTVGDVRNRLDSPSKGDLHGKANANHNHNSDYYGKSAVDTMLSGKAAASALTQEIIDRANADLALAAAKQDKFTGTTGQYVRGDGSLATFPTIPSAQVQADYAQTNNAAVDFIKNKPAGFSVGAATVSSVTLNSAFQPNATGASVVSIIGSFTALVSGGVTLSVQTCPTSSGTFVEVGVTNLITLLTALSNAKETLTVPVPAGHWLKVTATGGTPTVQKVGWNIQ